MLQLAQRLHDEYVSNGKAEAERIRRAKVIDAEGEAQAADRLADAGDIIARKDPGYERLVQRYHPDQRVGDILAHIGRLSSGGFYVAGTPKEVADALETWVDEAGVDGFNVRQFLTPGTAEDIIELVIPELQRRGLFKQRYGEPKTFREIFGLPSRPANRHVTAAERASVLAEPA
ncbi:MAG: hypothetical protein FWJ90_21550 [Actinomadura sp.]